VEATRIVLGVCGSIAAYKVAELARNLTLAGAQVDVVMTEAASRFVGAATFQALTGRPVRTSLWDLPEDGVVGHVSLGVHADLVVIAPATADAIARLAAGMADDLLTTTVLATSAPVMLAPAMNPAMWHHPATQANLATLRQRGVIVLEPAYGRMAEPVIGQGRLPEPAIIEAEARALLGRRRGALRGRRVVISAGGTHEPIDPVRFIGNRASGRMGFALAVAARDQGASVHLIAGATSEPPPSAVDVVRVATAVQMQHAVLAALDGADLLIMNAAVADYRPAQAAEAKLKKRRGAPLQLTLVENPDILGELAARRDVLKIGFAAETHDLVQHARDKLERKGLDAIVANDALASIGSADIALTVLDDRGALTFERMPKERAAAQLVAWTVARWPERLAPVERGVHERPR
jgi:phosphopantothenoylcysteine decarboxylase/phosphopantothenate--cysteine ligase